MAKTMTDLGRAGAAFKFIAVDASCHFGKSVLVQYQICFLILSSDPKSEPF